MKNFKSYLLFSEKHENPASAVSEDFMTPYTPELKESIEIILENEEVHPHFQDELATLAKRHSNVLIGLRGIDDHLRGIQMAKKINPQNDPATRQAASFFGLDPNRRVSNRPKDHFRSPIPTHFVQTDPDNPRRRIAVSDVVHIDDIHDMRQRALDSLDKIQGRMSLIDPRIRDHTSHAETASYLRDLTRDERGSSHRVHRLPKDMGLMMFGPGVNNPLNRHAEKAGPKSHVALRRMANRGGNQHTEPALHHPDIASAVGVEQETIKLHEGKRIPKTRENQDPDTHSDLYTDENPKGTIKGLGFKDVATAKKSVAKIKGSGKKHAHKIQAAIAMEQRARVANKSKEARIYRVYINAMKKKTKAMREDVDQEEIPSFDELKSMLETIVQEDKNPEHVEGRPKKESKKVPTGSAAEAHFVEKMGGKASKRKAGSQAPDIILSHEEHGTHVGEMKAGGTIDLAQQRFAVHKETGRLVHTTTGKIKGRIGKFVKGVTKRMSPLTPGTVKKTRISKKTGKKKTESRPRAGEELRGKDRRLRLNWKNTHSLMGSEEAIHIHVHPRTGHTVIVPNKRKHHHLGKKLGLKKTVSFHSLSKSHGGKRSGFSLRGFREKGSTINASFEGSSAHLVNAVRDAGGHVFDSIDHATEHLRKHGWSAKSGHKN